MPATVHVKRRLTNLSVHYPWEFESLGEEFFPRMPTEFLTDQFAVWNKANLLAIDELTPIGDDEEPPEVQLKLDADKSFSCQVYGIQSPGKWITQKNADPGLDYETERTVQLTTALRLRLEYLRVVQRLRSSAYMTNYGACPTAARFDNYTSASSMPIKTMQLIVDTLGYSNQGRKPNKIGMTTFVMRAIARSEEFKDLVKYQAIQNAAVADLNKSMAGQVALIEQLIGVVPGTIKISDAVYNSAASGQTPRYVTFMGPDVVFGYVEPWGLRRYSLSSGFQWSKYSNDPQAIIAVPRYQKTVLPVEDLRAFTVIDPMIVVPELGYLLTGVIDGTDTTSYGYLVSV